jgi:hypothetical protein
VESLYILRVHGVCIGEITPKNDIPELAEKYYNLSSIKINDLLYASRMAAKLDNATIQDGYSLYHHVILVMAVIMLHSLHIQTITTCIAT